MNPTTVLPKVNETLPCPRIRRSDSRFMFDTYAVLPSGTVTLSTGNMHLWKETTYAFWNHGERTSSFLLCEVNENTPVIIVTCGDLESTQREYPIGKRFEARHDQELYQLGTHEVVGVYPNTPAGLALIAQRVGRNTVRSATFK